MNTFISGFALTVTCFTGLYLLPNAATPTSKTVMSKTVTSSTVAQRTAAPCPSHSSLSPTVNPDRPQSEACNPWSSL